MRHFGDGGAPDEQSCPTLPGRPIDSVGRSEAERTLELMWHVLGGDPLVLGVTAAGLVGAVAGPWAIIRAASRPTKPRADD